MTYDHMQQLGLLALGSRMKRLSDRFMNDGARFYKAAGVPFQPKWFTLFTLVQQRPGITLTEAAEALGQSHAAISQAATAMHKAGLLSMDKSPQDERSKLLKLSKKAKALLPRLEEVWAVVCEANDALQQESGAELLQAIEAMEQVLDHASFYDRLHGLRREQQYDAIEILPYAPEYREYVGSLNEEWIAEYFHIEQRDRDMFADPEGYIMGKGQGAVFFARVDGQIVGTCSLFRHDNGVWELIRLGVTKAYQGRQIARKLTIATMEEALKRGVETLYITTNSRLTPALSLYYKLGYVTSQSKELLDNYERADVVLEVDLVAWQNRRGQGGEGLAVAA